MCVFVSGVQMFEYETEPVPVEARMRVLTNPTLDRLLFDLTNEAITKLYTDTNRIIVSSIIHAAYLARPLLPIPPHTERPCSMRASPANQSGIMAQAHLCLSQDHPYLPASNVGVSVLACVCVIVFLPCRFRTSWPAPCGLYLPVSPPSCRSS